MRLLCGAGEHTFLDVIDNSGSKKGEVRVIIELNFRAEFEMARASEDYNRLVQRLPEVYVGKVERLSTLIKILCSAAKKCMKEKKMHMGPWRKQKYMQAKWLSPCKRTTSTPNLSMGYSNPLPKPRASMLTVDLLEKLPNVRCTAVEVVWLMWNRDFLFFFLLVIHKLVKFQPLESIGLRIFVQIKGSPSNQKLIYTFLPYIPHPIFKTQFCFIVFVYWNTKYTQRNLMKNDFTFFFFPYVINSFLCLSITNQHKFYTLV